MELALPDDARNRFYERRGREAERIQSAQRQLATIGTIAHRGHWKVVILKGGVEVVDKRRAVDLLDLDLLLQPEETRAFAAALDQAAYRPIGEGTARHLDKRSSGEPVFVEVHHSLDRHGSLPPKDCWSRIVPFEAVNGLFRLDAGTHLWHVLMHAVVDHPERRGAIRDVLLITAAVADCSTEELEQVRQSIDLLPARSALHETLSMAEGLYAEEIGGDPMAYASAVRYAVRVLLCPLPLPRRLEGYVYTWTFALLSGPEERRNMWKDLVSKSTELSSQRHVAWIEQRAPSLGRAYRLAARLVRAVLALVVAVPTAVLARRLTHRRVGPSYTIG